MVRGFARWMAAFDPATEVPPADLLPVSSRRADPYPYSNDDIAGLMQAARAIRTLAAPTTSRHPRKPSPGRHGAPVLVAAAATMAMIELLVTFKCVSFGHTVTGNKEAVRMT
jgi:hypothetical protein